MSNKTATILTRTEPETKEAADILFEKIGMSTSTAVNVFLHKAVEVGGFPFETKIEDLDQITAKKAPDIPSLDKLTHEEVVAMLKDAEHSIQENGGYSAEEVFSKLREEFGYV